jgi:hypothetical protein
MMASSPVCSYRVRCVVVYCVLIMRTLMHMCIIHSATMHVAVHMRSVWYIVIVLHRMCIKLYSLQAVHVWPDMCIKV